MRVCLCSVPKNGIRPAYIHEDIVRREITYKNHRKTEVEREYVGVLQYSPRVERIEYARYFKKDIGEPYLVVADDLHSHLMEKVV